MENIISVENMRLSDLSTISNGVPSLTLMKNAAKGILDAHTWSGKIAIVTGSGNNGGDGFALACELANISIPCEIFALSEKVSNDSEFYKQLALSNNIPINNIEICSQDFFSDFDIIVDCIFGTGFHGEVRGLALNVINAINNSKAYTISADINSGINGDTGLANTAVKSDLTVSIGQLKNGFFINDAPYYIGTLINADIGILALKNENYLLNKEEFEALIDKLKAETPKYQEYSSMPSNIITLDDMKSMSKLENSALFIHTTYTSFLSNGLTVWVLRPQV